MAKDERDLLDLLKFELKFLEDGGYGRSPHTPWRRHVGVRGLAYLPELWRPQPQCPLQRMPADGICPR